MDELEAFNDIDGADTEQDNDESDDEQEGNYNHRGPQLLSLHAK